MLCVCSAEEKREGCLWILLLSLIYVWCRGKLHWGCSLLFLMSRGDQGNLGFSCPTLAACSLGLLCQRVSVDVMASIIQRSNLIALLHQWKIWARPEALSQKFSRILLLLVLLKMLCVSGCFLLRVQMELTAGSIYQPCHILHSVQSCFPFVLFFLWEDLCPPTVSPRLVCCPWACSRAAEMPACLANRACFHIGIGLCLLLERNNFPWGKMALRGQARWGKIRYICLLFQKKCRRGFCTAEISCPGPLEAACGYTPVSFLPPFECTWCCPFAGAD